MSNYFAAANTENGFVSWFSDIFDPRKLSRTYIIKGGSGTGKSTLMKKVAEKAENAGGSCEYFYCSSDPTSLDGIIITAPDGETTAMLDGTAPHLTDPKYPGAADEIVNLGEYWCSDILKAQRDEIVALTDKKARLYREAYSFFSSAGALYRSQLKEAESFLLREKLDAAVTRLLTKRMHECRVKGGKGVRRLRGLSALSTRGEAHFDSFEDVKHVCLAVDAVGTAPFLFDALIAAAERLGLSYDRAPMALIPELTEAIRFPELSMSVVSETALSDAKPINMTRFVDREALYGCDRTRRRLIGKATRELTLSGLDKLAEVNRIHSAVEKIYIGAMDFTRLETAASRLIERMGY